MAALALLSMDFFSNLRAQDGDDESALVDGAQACFYTRQASDFRALDRSNLIVYAPNRSWPYRVRISPPSNDLRSAETLAFSGRSNRICGHAGESVLIGRSGTGRQHSIIDVSRLDEDELQALLEQYDRGNGAKIVEPEIPDGSEFERELSDADN